MFSLVARVVIHSLQILTLITPVRLSKYCLPTTHKFRQNGNNMNKLFQFMKTIYLSVASFVLYYVNVANEVKHLNEDPLYQSGYRTKGYSLT